jgi:5-formyltetrahydrofolate cyclo-ligase
VLKVALAYEEQMTETVPREAHDKTVDVIVTEARLLQVPKTEEGRCRGGIDN